MPQFRYTAHDRRAGREVNDTIEAPSQGAALEMLKKQGLLPIEIKAAKAKKKAAPAKKSGGFGGGRVKPIMVTQFTRQLSTLQDAGLPIVQSLQILADMQRPGRFKSALDQVSEDVQSGTMLSDAMAHHPKIWDRLFTNLVKAGETAGALEAILQRLAEFREKAEKLKKKVKGAMIYPAAVAFVAVAILTFIMLVIVPKFEEIFEDMKIPLPAPTQLLIDMSRFIGSWWGAAALAGLIGLIIAVIFLKRTEKGGNVVDKILLRLPVLGNVAKKGAVARFTRTLGTLVTSGVGFLDALEITREATPNVVVRTAISNVRESVKEGESINEPLARSGVFNDIVINMIKVGEETGELDRMLIKIADNYDEEVDAAVAAMMALLEPALIVFMGVAVGFIVISLFLPLISILDSLQ